MISGLRIEKLARTTPIDGFDCGQEPLNRYLSRYAWQNQQAGAAQTYVAMDGSVVIGFYTLVVGEVAYDDASARVAKGLARHPVPIMLLARLAVSRDRHGRGLGAGLLKDAMLRTMAAAEIAGIRALTVHAKDAHARAFYEHFDFVASPADPWHLMLLLKDVRALLTT